MHSTIDGILNDPDFSSQMILKEYNLHLLFIYRGGSYIEYYAINTLNGNILFHGNDYRPSPLYPSIDGLDSMIGCLGFITLQEGATDEEYFSKYTSEQIEWSRSLECEQLNCLIGDYEDTNSEYHNIAVKYFTSAFSN